jgi:hypothetical protein
MKQVFLNHGLGGRMGLQKNTVYACAYSGNKFNRSSEKKVLKELKFT